jgi:hypothetical protein
MSGATDPKLQELLDRQKEANKRQQASRPRTTAPSSSQRTQKNFDLNNNTFAKIVFNKELDPKEKRDAIVSALTFDKDAPKEENQKRLKEFENFKEYLQDERKKMALDIIELSDTDAFAELHEMFKEMSGALIEFDESLEPLTAILDAVYTLRMQGKEVTTDVIKEIKEDKEAQAKRDEELATAQASLTEKKEKFDANKKEINHLSTQKRFFGLFGGLKPEAEAGIKNLTEEQTTLEADIAAEQAALKELKESPLTETQFAEFAAEKEKIRELLDISSEEHKERQKRLVAAAQNFVNTTSERGERVLAHIGALGEHLDTLGDANRGITGIYSILSDASARANEQNRTVKDDLEIPPEGKEESNIEKTLRENKLKDVKEHIVASDRSTQDTKKTLADLTGQSSRIMTMKNANIEQITKARELTSSGVAGVADGLSSTLSIISAAALNESAEMARNTVDQMNDRTDRHSQEESLRQADSLSDQTDDLLKAIDRLSNYKETSKIVADTTQANLESAKAETERLHQELKDAREEIERPLDNKVGVNLQENLKDEDEATAKDAFKDASANDNAEKKAQKPAETGVKKGPSVDPRIQGF